MICRSKQTNYIFMYFMVVQLRVNTNYEFHNEYSVFTDEVFKRHFFFINFCSSSQTKNGNEIQMVSQDAVRHLAFQACTACRKKKKKKISYWLSVLFPIVIYKIKKAKQNYSQKIYFFRKIYNTQALFFYIGIRTI